MLFSPSPHGPLPNPPYTVRRGDYRNYYKGHMDQIKGEGEDGGGEVGSAAVGWRDGEKRHTTVIE